MGEYEFIFANIVGVYRYIEGEKCEQYWVDSQNCEYNTFHAKGYDEETELIDGKNWWIIWPAKPIGYTPTEEDMKKPWKWWYVMDSSKTEDHNKEWNFEKHCVV